MSSLYVVVSPYPTGIIIHPNLYIKIDVLRAKQGLSWISDPNKEFKK